MCNWQAYLLNLVSFNCSVLYKDKLDNKCAETKNPDTQFLEVGVLS